MVANGTPADNKTQIVKSFQQLLESRKRAASQVATKEIAAEKQKDAAILAQASTYTIETTVKGLADLQLDFGNTIDAVATKLTTETGKLDELRRAIEVERENLVDLNNTQIAADALDILTQEHREQLRTFEEDQARRTTELETEISDARTNWKKEQESFDRLAQEHAELIQKERQQAEADYQYEVENRRKIEANTYEDRKRKLEIELTETEKEKEKRWTEREAILTERQPQIEEHKTKVETMPAELEKAIKTAREDAIKDTHEAEKQKALLLEKETEATHKIFDLKIQSLEATVTHQTEEIAHLTTQLQTALKQVQELAMRAIEGTTKHKLSAQ